MINLRPQLNMHMSLKQWAQVNSKFKINVWKLGPTVRDVKFMSDKEIAKRRNENYRRVKASTLMELLK